MAVHRFILAVALVACTPALTAQQSVSAPARGRVVDASTGAPLARAGVMLYLAYAADRPATRILTDDRGGFELPFAGRPSFLHVTKAGYATVVVRVPDDRAGAFQVALSRGAAIRGRAVDGLGRPAQGMLVRATPVDASGAAASSPSYFTARTDDHGEYRISGLREGQYRVGAVTFRAGNADQAIGQSVRLRQGAPLELTPSSEVTIVDLSPGGEAVAADSVVSVPAQSCGFTSPVAAETASGMIRGRVTTFTGGALRCATVRLRQPGVSPRILVTNTDPDGWFEFRGLAGGSYLVEGTATHHAAREAMVSLTSEQRIDNVALSLVPLPAITGTVVDEHGEAIAGASIRALQVRSLGGRQTAVRAEGGGGETDDRGEYRFYGVQPGVYLVSATVDGVIAGAGVAGGTGYAPIYYPSTSGIASAATVTVGIGADATGVVIVMSPSGSGRITGTAVDRNGQPFAGPVLLSVSDRSGAILLEPRQAGVAPDGTFEFDSVAPGEYVVQAFIRPSASVQVDGQFGMQYVNVIEGETATASIRMTGGSTIEGRISVEGAPPGTGPPAVVAPFPAEFDRSSGIGSGTGQWAVPSGQGQFRTTGVTGARRFVLLSGTPEDWYIRSARVNGVDALVTPFDFGLGEAVIRDVEVVISSTGAAVQGAVVNAQNRGVIDYAVVVFSTFREHWFVNSQFVKFARSRQDGSFQVRGLAPGDYYAVAVDRIDGTIGSGEWQDPALLELLVPVAERISVSEGERLPIQLRLIRR